MKSILTFVLIADNKLLDACSSLKAKNAQVQIEFDRLKAENFQLAVKADSG